MTLQIEEEARRARELLARSDVREAMRIRCEETEHSWEGGADFGFPGLIRIFQICKWCGERQP